MAALLTETVAMTRKLEGRLDVVGGWREATAEIDIDADPAETLRIAGALLLRKARIHTVAVLRATRPATCTRSRCRLGQSLNVLDRSCSSFRTRSLRRTC